MFRSYELSFNNSFLKSFIEVFLFSTSDSQSSTDTGNSFLLTQIKEEIIRNVKKEFYVRRINFKLVFF